MKKWRSNILKTVMIVLNYNDSETTQKLINKVRNYKNIEKIIIVDNKSSDDSYMILKKMEDEKVIVIQTKANLGYAYGNNIGVKYAIDKYDPAYCIIANPDISFDEKIIDRLIQEADKNNSIGIITAKMAGNINAWKIPTWFDGIKSMFLFWNKFSKKYEKLDSKINEVGVVSGSFFIIASEAYKNVNGFDERTFLYGEENILAFKLKKNNYKTILLSDIEYEHHHSVSIKKQYKSKVKPFLIYVKSLKIYNKYYIKANILQNIIFNIFYMLAYIERCIYNLIMMIKIKGVAKSE